MVKSKQSEQEQEKSRERYKKLKRRYKLLQWKSKTREIFVGIGRFLQDAGDVTNLALNQLPTRRSLWRKYFGKDSAVKAANYRRIVRRMKKRKLLREKSGGAIEVTERGHLELVRQMIWEKMQFDEWDGVWRLVIFDIPEEHRGGRDFLRRRLEEFGFQELHRSVWVTPIDVEEELRKFVTLADIHLGGDLRFIVVKSISNDDDLREYFGLS